MDTPFTDTITTADEFEATLQNLLMAAATNDIPVEGGWECNGTDGNLWDVVITRVEVASDD